MKSLREIAESLSIAVIMICVLLPIRLFFVTYINTHWLGSLGVISIVSFAILFLAKKNKLGWFGRAFIRQTFKINKGKRKYFVYTNLAITLIYFGSIIYGVELSNEQFLMEKIEVKEKLGTESIEEIMTSDKVDVRDVPKALLMLVYIFFFRFDIYAVLIGTINDMTQGYLLHFSIVFTVEVLELLGILIFSRFYLKKEDISFK